MQRTIVLAFVGAFMVYSTLSQAPQKPMSEYSSAMTELESVLDKSNSIRDTRKNIVVRAKAANLLWLRDPASSRQIFTKLWEKIDRELDSESFNKEASRIDVLEQLFPRDRELARRLIATTNAGKTKHDTLMDTLKGTNPNTQRLSFLAYKVAEEDPALAASVVEQAVAENSAPSLALILNRIRDTDPVLANYVTSRAIGAFSNQPATVALSGLVNVAAFLFPLAPSTDTVVDDLDSEDRVRQEFAVAGYAILRRSLAESDEVLTKEQGFTAEAFRLRKFNQTVVAGMLAAMSPKYDFQNFVELNAISERLMRSIPAQFVPVITLQVGAVKAALGRVEDSEVSESEIISALARRDFAGAELLIAGVKDESRQKTWTNILYRTQARFHIQKGDSTLALSSVKKIDVSAMAIPLLIEVAKLAARRKDESSAIVAFQELEGRSGGLSKGLQAKTTFTVASEMAYLMKSQCLVALQKATGLVNSLSEIKNEQSKPASYRGETYWEDPDNFVTSSALWKAFSVLGQEDLTESLSVADKLHDSALQMVARLAVIERVLRKGPPIESNDKKNKKADPKPLP